MKKTYLLITSILFVLFLFACQNYPEKKITIDFADTAYSCENTPSLLEKPIYIAIASMASPEETVNNYHNFLNYISNKLNKSFVLKQRKTYEEVNELLKNGEVDFAFICSGAYIEGKKNGFLKILVVPQHHGSVKYQAYIICHKNSAVNNFEDFRNKSFAFTDPLSTTGRLFPKEKISDLKTNEQLFLKQIIYTYAHDISIEMVNREIIDGASVHSLIYDHFVHFKPEKVANIKILEKSELYGNPPVVVPVNLDESKFLTYQKFFLDLHKDSIGRKILDELNIEKYRIVDDSMYNSVRMLTKNFSNENN